ncbi:uncharacterized protein B0P05DRAFT_537438 [Gilbertella persicaria]|uniref:uncharacterized protein n=1 Tax=Gilbertella persicaria TaxID=101096 RepID=UPI00221EA819|nr:uncharacterized protein B0P05DRAFT_537438 [Gilbertella persicaria]KAI8082541.1 hypothetical protein B0P05DRAFT_537438 [Gilbertella persicaria]
MTSYFFILLVLFTFAHAQNLINIDVPKPNEMIYNKELLNMTFTVIGSQTVSPAVSDYYPSSLIADFVWTERANTANVLSFNIASGLNTSPYPGGTQSIQRKESWRVPDCHFFSRYSPTAYDFSIVFTPVYPVATETSPATGIAQDKIVIPLSITVDNSTFPKC